MSEFDLLRFPAQQYDTEFKTVKLVSGPKDVEYRVYKHIPYVRNPVNLEYQSMDIWVPIAIDGVPYDAADAPILMAINVAGYLSSSNYTSGMMPPPMGDGMDMPGGGGMPGPPELGDGEGRFLGLGGEKGPDANKYMALAYGFVVVCPGCRGRDNQNPDGTFFGKAPAAIVDLKAAVRYLRHNRGILPGNPEYIMTSGGSAGGAMSALLASTGNAPEYEPYLEAIGAAKERDDVFACVGYSPMVNLENMDSAYEWEMGAVPAVSMPFSPFPITSGLVDQELSREIAGSFPAYQDSLKLSGRNGFGIITADRFSDYFLQEFLIPSAERYLANLSAEEKEEYLSKHDWLTEESGKVSIDYPAFLLYRGRSKGVPATDDLTVLPEEEPSEKPKLNPPGMDMRRTTVFGTEMIDGRHYTEFCLRRTTGDPNATVNEDVKHQMRLMNPMYFLLEKHPGHAKHWWLRYGGKENDAAFPIFVNLVTAAENAGIAVDAQLVWDGGHCSDDDPEGVYPWMLGLKDSNK